MKLHDFMMLPYLEQCKAIVTKTEFVTSIDDLGVTYELYALGSMFIELEREFFTRKILGQSIFRRGTKLEKYWGSIESFNKILAD